MGLAITLVIFYHTYCLVWNWGYVFSLFSYGFIGVDIFLLVNALGCSHSLEKNTISRFYLNRLRKTAPLFVVFAAIQTLLLQFFTDYEYTTFDWLCNLTTLSYWHIGGQIVEWYISASVLLWLFTPLFMVIVRKIGLWSILISIIIMAITMKLSASEWYYNCLMGRVPIYLTGIYLYHRDRINAFWYLPIGLILGLLGANGYLIISMCCPLLMVLFLIIKNFEIIKSITRMFNFLGRYTLEIYFANGIALYVFKELQQSYGMDKPCCLLGYAALNAILAIAFVQLRIRPKRSVHT